MLAAAVVALGGAGVGVAELVLDVLERHPAGESFGGEGVAKRVRLGRVSQMAVCASSMVNG